MRRMELEHLEREKREREMRELRERELNDRLKEELMKNAVAGGAPRLPNPLDPHWLDLNRRYLQTACQFQFSQLCFLGMLLALILRQLRPLLQMPRQQLRPCSSMECTHLQWALEVPLPLAR